jgi:hypothetical protein
MESVLKYLPKNTIWFYMELPPKEGSVLTFDEAVRNGS